MPVACFFFQLEGCHLLRRQDKHHCWLLHYLFLGFINEDCEKFCDEWNPHLVSGDGGGFSPNISYLVMNHVNRWTGVSNIVLGPCLYGRITAQYLWWLWRFDQRRSHIFYNFYENGELHSDDEDSNQSENEELEDSPYEEYSEDHSTNSMDINESEDVADLDHGFNTIPRYGVNKISIWYNLTISQRKLILIFIMRPFQYPLNLFHWSKSIIIIWTWPQNINR